MLDANSSRDKSSHSRVTGIRSEMAGAHRVTLVPSVPIYG